MSNEPKTTNGKICYVEIPSKNISESSEFYQKVFGWKIRTRGDGNVAFDDATGQVSGTWVLGRKPLDEFSLMMYIMVDSIEDTSELIKSNGGKVLMNHNISDKEKIAKFHDPSLNVFGLYQNP